MSTRFLPAGDAGIVVELGDTIDLELNARVRALDRALQATPFDGYVEAIPSYRSLLVFFDPDRAGFDEAAEHLRGLLTGPPAAPEPEPELKEIPTVYDGEDLEEVAERLGATVDDVVRLHSDREYRVYVVGFTPGFAYMGRTHPKLDLPRRRTPRTRVPAGSVAIAMGQTGVYPSDTPGGWHLLGRADPRPLFDVDAEPPSRFVAGDRVRFVPVDELGESPARRRPATRPDGVEVLAVEDGGLSTTVQDLGRPGFQRYGVPVAGAADPDALVAANRCVRNSDGAAALECTVQGPRLRALTAVVVALAGADLGAVVERADLGAWRPPPEGSFLLRPGNVLAFDGRRSGARAYLAVAGGVDVPVVLGSRSTYLTAGFGGLEGRPLRAGDRIAACSRPELRLGASSAQAVPPSPDEPVRVIWGPQDDYFGEEGCRTLVTGRFVVAASSDRMGCRLQGPAVAHRGAKEIISDGNALGSIQIPPDGQPIVMLADRATTGGYPKIATVVTEDVGRVAQRLPGESLSFRAVELRDR